MFTGIVTDIGEIRALEHKGDLRARIGTSYDTAGIDIGASIACSGVCLTVVQLGPDWFDVEISAETLDKTTIGSWAVGARINLERALKVGDELGGAPDDPLGLEVGDDLGVTGGDPLGVKGTLLIGDAGISKVDYANALAAAGRDQNMSFRWVFVESCASELADEQIRALRGNVGLVFASDVDGLEYRPVETSPR